MRTLTLLALTVACLTVPPSAAAAAPTCQGERATLVGKPDSVIEGTPHRDVVVTNGASYTRTYGGADLVCVTRGGIYNEAALVEGLQSGDIVVRSPGDLTNGVAVVVRTE